MEYSHSKLDPKADLQFCFVGFDALRPNSFSVMSGQLLVVLGWNSTKQMIKCLVQGHNAVPLMSLKPVTLQPQI